MSPALHRVVEEAYRLFAGYAIGGRLCVCHCASCMSEETGRALLATPLRQVPAALLAEYTNSAHDWSDEVARELRHFLPRYFELIAENDPPDHLGLDICLRRLGKADWRTNWPAAEVEIIDRFFEALMAASVARLDLALWPAGWRLAFDISDVLTLAVTARGNVDRVLAAWDGAPDPAAAIHMAALRRQVLAQSGRTFFHSPYLEDYRGEADLIGAFLARPEIDQRIEAALPAAGDERLQQILLDGAW